MISELYQDNWQLKIGSNKDYMWDVIIVGAGPSGSIAAIYLASYGHRVLLIDKQRFPREKVCGDGLITDAIQCLKRVELLQKVRQMAHLIQTSSVFSPSRIEIEMPGDYLTLRRCRLDSLIARKAVSCGALFCQGTVNNVSVESNGSIACSILGCDKVYRARVGVIAEGACVDLAKKLRMVTQKKASAKALRCYVRSSFELNRMILSYDRSIIPGYAWIFPMGNDEYNVGCGIFYRGQKKNKNIREKFSLFTTEFPLAQKLMQHGKTISPLRGARLRCGLKGTRAVGEGNLLAIGETIGTTFPFTGEGIGTAMESGELAAAVIHEALDSGDFNRLQEFPIRLEKELKPRYKGYNIAENWLSKAWLSDFLALRARKSKFLRDSLASISTICVLISLPNRNQNKRNSRPPDGFFFAGNYSIIFQIMSRENLKFNSLTLGKQSIV